MSRCFPRFGALLAHLGTSLALGACGARAAAPPALPPEPEQRPEQADPAERWGLVELGDVPATLALFEPDAWTIASGRSFTVLEHARTGSTLALRVWNASRLVRPADCEAEARLFRPDLPEVDPEAILEERELAQPSGFEGRLVVGIARATRAGRDDARARAYVFAVGAAVGRCYVACFETPVGEAATAPTTGTMAEVAGRLRDVADATFGSVRIGRIDERLRTMER